MSFFRLLQTIITKMTNSSAKSSYDPVTKIWSGPKLPLLYNKDQSIGQAALEALFQDPRHIYQICHHNGKQYTNQEIATYSIRVAQNLKEKGFKEGDVIGICADTSDFIAPLFLGSLLEGLVTSSLDPSFDKESIIRIYSMTQPKIVICDGSIYEKVKQAFEEMELDTQIYTIEKHLQEIPCIKDLLKKTNTEKDYKPKTLTNGGDSLAVILCSSSTTDLPKGVCLSHAALLHSNYLNLGKSDTFVNFSKLYLLSGILHIISCALRGATRVIDSRGFTPKAFFESIQNYKGTITIAPSSQMAMCVGSNDMENYDLSSLKFCISFSTSVPFTVVEKLKKYLPNCNIFGVYGLAEMAGAISFGPISFQGSNGHLVPYMEAKIIDTNGNYLEPGKPGVVCVRSCFKWLGYYKNSEATQVIMDSEGWIYTGDLGYLSEKGDIYIIDRIEEIMKYNDFQFFSTEIENVISQMPGVNEVCVCGVPDEMFALFPAAAVVKCPDSNLSKEDICDFVNRKMDHFNQLRGGVYFMDELPKTPSGNNLRRDVVQLCVAMSKRRVSAIFNL